MKPISILLYHEQSGILADTRDSAFVVVGRGSYPHSAGRFVLYILPSIINAVGLAVGVAKGTHRAVKIHTSSKQ
jgi:hypothetical protein